LHRRRHLAHASSTPTGGHGRSPEIKRITYNFVRQRRHGAAFFIQNSSKIGIKNVHDRNFEAQMKIETNS
ncbi:MAG: hypothetical protein L0J72_02995, partial [Lacticaseibacillus paracasei]|nr:hypothetical protein [Lacticaseibacillus paracasei]